VFVKTNKILFLNFLATMAPLRWNTSASTVAGQLSMTNATPYYLNGPSGIFIDSSNTLYVADGSNNRVQQFLLGSTIGTTVAGQPNGSFGSQANRLWDPSDVAVDLNGNIYVAEINNNRVQLWHVNATSGITVAGNGKKSNKNHILILILY
jgi:sugar lactone lactonase YvrE